MENVFILTNQITHENRITWMAIVRPIASGIVSTRKEEMLQGS